MFGFVNRARLASALFLGAALFALPPSSAAADDEGLTGLDGTRLTEAELSEGNLIIVVWASWSPRSRGIGPRVEALAARWSDKARVITVNFQEGADKARSFARAQRLEVPVYLDPEAVFAKRYAVTSLPFLLVLSDGEAAFAGKLPADPDRAIARALG